MESLLDTLHQRDLVERLQRAMREFPQLEMDTEHYFADGMYCRVLPRPKGALIVGKVHKREHFYMVVSGKVAVTVGEVVTEYTAPAVLVSKPGTKRAVLALEDSVCLTVHRTDKTDLDEIERELIEEDPTTLFNSSNKLKSLEYKA